MTNVQLYFAIGIPGFMVFVSLLTNFTLMYSFKEAVKEIRDDIKEINKNIKKVESDIGTVKIDIATIKEKVARLEERDSRHIIRG